MTVQRFMVQRFGVQKTETRGQNTEDRGQTIEVGGGNSEVGKK